MDESVVGWGVGMDRKGVVVERAMMRSGERVVCVGVCGMRNGGLDWQWFFWTGGPETEDGCQQVDGSVDSTSVCLVPSMASGARQTMRLG